MQGFLALTATGLLLALCACARTSTFRAKENPCQSLSALRNSPVAGSQSSEAALVGGTTNVSASDKRSQSAVVFRGKKMDLSGEVICSGVLVTERLVLTAGHCLYDNRVPHVFFGSHIETGEMRDVAQVVPHPNFVPGEFQYDIGWMELAEPAPSGYQPIAMAKDVTEVGAGMTAAIVGYGRSASENQDAGERRMFTDRVDKVLLQGKYAHYATLNQVAVSGKNSCSGDSGAPVFIKNGTQWRLAGINIGRYYENGQAGSCEQGAPLFLILAHYLDWVEFSSDTAVTTISPSAIPVPTPVGPQDVALPTADPLVIPDEPKAPQAPVAHQEAESALPAPSPQPTTVRPSSECPVESIN